MAEVEITREQIQAMNLVQIKYNKENNTHTRVDTGSEVLALAKGDPVPNGSFGFPDRLTKEELKDKIRDIAAAGVIEQGLQEIVNAYSSKTCDAGGSSSGDMLFAITLHHIY